MNKVWALSRNWILPLYIIHLFISSIAYGNYQADDKYSTIPKHIISFNTISPFLSIFNVNYGYRFPNKKTELINSITYFYDIQFKTMAGFSVIESDLNALNYLISLRKYKNINFNHEFYGIGFRLLYIESHDSDIMVFLTPVTDIAGGRILPKSLYLKDTFIGINFEAGYTANIGKFILTASASAAKGLISENIESLKWRLIKKLVFFPSVNLTIGWQF